jgi:hypothetical protein
VDLAHYFQESTQHIEDEPQVTSLRHAVFTPTYMCRDTCKCLGQWQWCRQLCKIRSTPVHKNIHNEWTFSRFPSNSSTWSAQADGTREVSVQHSADDAAKQGGNDAPVEAWHELKSPVDFSKTVGRIRVQTQSATLQVS